MTITRRWQVGFEANGNTSAKTEVTTYNDPNATDLVVTTGYNGGYAVQIRVQTGIQMAIPATRQVRLGFYAYGGKMTAGKTLARWLQLSNLVYVTNPDNTKLQLTVGGSVQAEYSVALPITSWAHFGVDCKIHSSAGWVVVYRNGAPILSYSGNTGNADLTYMRFGWGTWSGEEFDWNTGGLLVDHVYLDDTTDEAAAAPVPMKQFLHVVANGNGTYSQWTGSDGDSTNNYAHVDERPHTSDTDYVLAATADLIDSYALADVTLPALTRPVAVVPYAWVRRTNGVVASQVAMFMRGNAADWTGTTQTPDATYGLLWDRKLTDPSGEAWTEAKINALEAGCISKGTF